MAKSNSPEDNPRKPHIIFFDTDVKNALKSEMGKNGKHIHIGLVDADLLCNGTRHPNLALLKIAGYLRDNGIPYELIIDKNANINNYTRIYLSKVFTFTKLPPFIINADGRQKKKIVLGGTGFYAEENNVNLYRQKREKDMVGLENDPYLNKLTNFYDGTRRHGIDMARQMPDYHLYDNYVNRQISLGFKPKKYKDYLKYSIGFLTRGCVRHCPFCINKLENRIIPYSDLKWFLDNETDEKGKLIRPYIYLWDDNFLAADPTVWRTLLQKLIETKRPFQFRQGLDERMLAESPYGEEMAEMLSRSKYHGDFIFAFDNWHDRPKIEKALKIWKRHCPRKGTKFYLFCGYKQEHNDKRKFYKDIWELFQRIRVLMQYGCVGYVMRHEDYHKAPISNIYIQIARWCNQQAFYKKMSFWEFIYRNQSYWEEHTLKKTGQSSLISFEDFERKKKNGYYNEVKMCLPLVSLTKTLDLFPENRQELIEMFNYKMSNLKDPSLWEEV